MVEHAQQLVLVRLQPFEAGITGTHAEDLVEPCLLPFAHVVECSVIDRAGFLARTEMFKEIEAAFRAARPEMGKEIIADRRAITVLGLTAGTSIVDVDPRSAVSMPALSTSCCSATMPPVSVGRNRPASYVQRIRNESGGGCGKVGRGFLWKTIALPSIGSPVHSCVGTAAAKAWRRRSGAWPRRTGRTESALDRRIRGPAWSARPPVRLPGPGWMLGSRTESSRG